MEGKQVWYITAPASLPVTIVQDLSIPLDSAQKGLPVLTHNGDDYRLAFEDPSASSSFRLLIPNKKGHEYSERTYYLLLRIFIRLTRNQLAGLSIRLCISLAARRSHLRAPLASLQPRQSPRLRDQLGLNQKGFVLDTLLWACRPPRQQ